MTRRRLRYGMIGGGPGAFIGDVHRMAAELDGLAELTAGAFSSDPGRSRAKADEVGLDPARAYGSFREMAETEAARPADDRLDFVIIVTPNHLHFAVARAFLDAGFHIVCDKPLTTTVEDAEALCRRVASGSAVFALTHNYTGYPMVKEARHLVRQGRLGQIRRIQAEYLQGWLSSPLEQSGHRQAEWRTDPARAGVAGALGDIGTHAHNLARYVTGLEVESLCADLTTFVEGRGLEDDAGLLLRWTDGARGALTASQIATGEENGLSLRVYGTEGSLAWRQEDPETLMVRDLDGRVELRRRGHEHLCEAARAASRLPPGHPEGFIEGFANIYREVAAAISRRGAGAGPETDFTTRGKTGDAGADGSPDPHYPTVWDGARGVHFLERAVASAEAGGWVDARYTPPEEPGS